MTSINCQISDPGSFLCGLLCNIVRMQWWMLKPLILDHEPGIDFTRPDIQRRFGEQVVDLVIAGFGTSRAARDVQAMREDLVQMVIDGMPQEPEPFLKLVE